LTTAEERPEQLVPRSRLAVAGMSPEQALEVLGTDWDGLRPEQVSARLRRNGPNAVPESGGYSLVREFVSQFTHFFALALWTSAALAFAGRMPELGWAIAIVVLVNGLFSFAAHAAPARHEPAAVARACVRDRGRGAGRPCLRRGPRRAKIWNEVRAVWPAGAGISYARLEHGGLQWPCPTEDHPDTTVLHTELRGRRTRGAAPRRIRAHAGGRRRGLPAATRHRAQVARLAVQICIEPQPGQVFATFHTAAAFLNEVTGPYRDRTTRTPEYKVTAIRLEKG
jgi:hypothetical protein